MEGQINELSSFLSVDLKVPETGSVILKKSITHPSNHQHYIQLLSSLINTYLVPGLKTSSKIQTLHDVQIWRKEVQSFLDEIGIPLSLDKLDDSGSTKLSLISWIVEEIQCLRLGSFANRAVEDSEDESSGLRALLKSACISLSLSKPPPHLSPSTFFDKLFQAFQKSSASSSSPPILSQKLSDEQWTTLTQIKNDLNEEYSIRWVMLLARLDSTIQSFTWSNRLDDKKKVLVEETYGLLKNRLEKRPNVSLGDLLSASQASLRFEKLSSSKNKASSDSSFTKVKMGKVPDRGGRPRETPAPPPEVPSWQQNNNNRGRGGGHQNRGRGGQKFQDNRGQQGYNNQGYNNQGYNNQGYNNQGYNNQGYNNQGYNNQGYNNQGYNNQGYNNQGYNNQGYNNQGYNNQGYNNQGYNNQGYNNSRGSNQYDQGYQGHQRGGHHHGNRGGYRGRDSGDPQGKKRRVQDNRF